MATRAGNSSPKEPVAKNEDYRRPVAHVTFRQPVALRGVSSTLFSVLEPGTRRVVDGKDFLIPQVWYIPEFRVIRIEGRDIPLENVAWYDLAPAAVTKTAPPLNLEQYTLKLKR